MKLIDLKELCSVFGWFMIGVIVVIMWKLDGMLVGFMVNLFMFVLFDLLLFLVCLGKFLLSYVVFVEC